MSTKRDQAEDESTARLEERRRQDEEYEAFLERSGKLGMEARYFRGSRTRLPVVLAAHLICEYAYQNGIGYVRLEAEQLGGCEPTLWVAASARPEDLRSDNDCGHSSMPDHAFLMSVCEESAWKDVDRLGWDRLDTYVFRVDDILQGRKDGHVKNAVESLDEIIRKHDQHTKLFAEPSEHTVKISRYYMFKPYAGPRQVYSRL